MNVWWIMDRKFIEYREMKENGKSWKKMKKKNDKKWEKKRQLKIRENWKKRNRVNFLRFFAVIIFLMAFCTKNATKFFFSDSFKSEWLNSLKGDRKIRSVCQVFLPDCGWSVVRSKQKENPGIVKLRSLDLDPSAPRALDSKKIHT